MQSMLLCMMNIKLLLVLHLLYHMELKIIDLQLLKHNPWLLIKHHYLVLLIILVLVILHGDMNKLNKILILSMFYGLLIMEVIFFYLYMLILKLQNKKMIGLIVLLVIVHIKFLNILDQDCIQVVNVNHLVVLLLILTHLI